ncbi:DUF3150 domain-containing protein [Sulfuricystis multivorans]|uniref:DUF3150 domain-containing protein n=1 Tax=Sulfuricystis multivorans TaxID=2211108 RepID=UPI000F8368A6|nr:DUF3150 domain-containing protein [Sulfuricystis multivorans]
MQDVLNEKLTLVSITINTFSGYRRATREHIAALGGSLPDSAAITEGSIKVFPCDGTKALQTVRRGIFRKLQAKGVRALGSQNVFAVLTDDLPEIEKEVADAEAEFKAEVNALEANYDQMFEAHVAANPEAEAIIRSLKVDRATAIAKCRFSSDVFKIAPFVREGQSEEEGVEGIVRGLGRQLYEEISSEMEKLLKNDAFAKNQRVGQKSLRPLKAAVQKMKKLSFLDPSVEGAITLITDILKALPQEGYIQGQSFLTLEKLVETMSDADMLLNAASKVKNGIPACDVLFPPAPQAAKATEVEEVAQATEPAAPVAPVAVPPGSVAQQHVVMLPPIPAANVPTSTKGAGASVSDKLGQLGIVPPPAPVRAAPVLRPREALKTNSLMF